MTLKSSSKATPMVTFDHLNLFNKMKLKTWIENLDFFLEQEKISYVLTEPCPKGLKRASPDIDLDKKIAKWKDDDCLCRNFILKTMFNPQLCAKSKTAKDLWDTLKTAYMDEMKQESWRELRMEFFMRQKEIAYVLVEPCPDAEHILSDQGKREDINEKIRKWKEDDYSCRYLILQEAVVPQFAKHKSAKELRDNLKTFYMSEEASIVAENNREITRLRREVVQKHCEETIASLTERSTEGEKEMARLMRKVAEGEEEIARLRKEEGEREELARKQCEEKMTKLEQKLIRSEEEITGLKQGQEAKQNQQREEITKLKLNVARKEDEIKRLKQNVPQRFDLDGSYSETVKKLKREAKRRDEEIKMLRRAIVPAWKQLNEVMIGLFSQQNSLSVEEEEEDDDDVTKSMVKESRTEGDEGAKFDESDTEEGSMGIDTVGLEAASHGSVEEIDFNFFRLI